MGACCTSNVSQTPGGDTDLGYAYQAQTLGGKTFTAREIWIIVRIQSAFRMWLAKRRV